MRHPGFHCLPSHREAARLLGGELGSDSVISCPAPGHSQKDRSLRVWLTGDGPRVHAFAGDDTIQCLDYVREKLGLTPWAPGGQPHGLPRRVVQPVRSGMRDEEVRRSRDTARALWDRSKPGRDTMAEKYLKSRGIDLPSWPPTLRFLSATPPKHPWPAMVAAYAPVTESEPGVLAPVRSEDIAGIQLTYLQHDGTGKAPVEPQKRSIGRDHAMPIVLAAMTDSLGVVIAEGIEDALSLHLATGLAAWAAGGASRLPALATVVPSYVESATIVADDDVAGRKGATQLSTALTRTGLCVHVLLGIGGRDGEAGR